MLTGAQITTVINGKKQDEWTIFVKNSFKVDVEYTAAIEVFFEKQCAISTLKGY